MIRERPRGALSEARVRAMEHDAGLSFVRGVAAHVLSRRHVTVCSSCKATSGPPSRPIDGDIHLVPWCAQ